MWQAPTECLALLELLVRSTLKRRRAQLAAWDALAELPWTRRTGRRDELGLVEARRGELVSLLNRAWPAWVDVLAALTARGLMPTPEGWAALEDAQRAGGLPTLPDQLNRRTAAALVAPHSKAALTDRRLAALGDVESTHDGAVRLRPPRGLVARMRLRQGVSARSADGPTPGAKATIPGGAIDLAEVAAVLGEVSLPERALKAGLELEGAVRAVLLIENLGAFCDLPSREGWLFAYVAGWDTATVVHLLERLAHVPVVHFGDLDPNGVRIVRHLRAMRSDLRWFVPPFWEEFVSTKGLPGAWPDDLHLADAPELVQRLANRGLWLEQEPIVVDPRTPAALEALL